MIKSMTGYGKAEASLDGGKLTIEIRSLNGKSADINIKTSMIPKDKELEVRSRLAERLVRGTIDVFFNWEPNVSETTQPLNADVVRGYFSQVRGIAGEMDVNAEGANSALLLHAVLQLPDVVDTKKHDIVNDDNWPAVSNAIDRCIALVDEYRVKEGEALYKDVTSRVGRIVELYNGVESHEKERLDAIREKIQKAADDMQLKMDKERFEQEMIFYLEKLDINEEKVRLRQHCKYFMDTIDSEAYPGKKLGFIIQEMGREINTTGSKANHAEIQKLVVQMKDELEKIREQSMNIL